ATVEYSGPRRQGAHGSYAVQGRPAGLCYAVVLAVPFVDGTEAVIVGLPDTIWFPADALRALPEDVLSFLLFPVERPEYFDAVVTDESGAVREIQVKEAHPSTHWVWGSFRMPGTVLQALHALWRRRRP